MIWTQEQSVALCTAVESVCVPYGCHVALTGGCLYKTGLRKDCDLLFYRVRLQPEINLNGLFVALETVGLYRIRGAGWCHKALFEGKPVDLFFPEYQDESFSAYPN